MLSIAALGWGHAAAATQQRASHLPRVRVSHEVCWAPSPRAWTPCVQSAGRPLQSAGRTCACALHEARVVRFCRHVLPDIQQGWFRLKLANSAEVERSKVHHATMLECYQVRGEHAARAKRECLRLLREERPAA